MKKNTELNSNLNNKQNRFEDLLIVLVKYRKMIFLNVFIVSVAAIIISLLIPKKYTAENSFISPKKQGGLFGDIAGVSSTIKDLSKSLGGRLGTVSEEAYNYLVILQSRTASQKVIAKFNLKEVYELDDDLPYEKVIEELEDNVEFNIEDEGNIVVSVTDKEPQRAASMANYYVEILNEISTELSITEARNNRLFIERRFIQLQQDIINIEDSLERFSTKYHVLEMEEQMKAAITVAADLKAQIELAKIEMDLLKASYGDDSPMVVKAEFKVNELQKRLKGMKFGEDENLASSLNLFIPFQDVPSVGIKYLRLMRDYEIQTRVLEFLYPIYEQAKIEEQKNIPVVVVVDEAIAPEKKSSPKRSLIVVGAFLLSLFVSIGYALINNSYSSLKEDTSRYNRIRTGIIDPLKNSLSFKKNK